MERPEKLRRLAAQRSMLAHAVAGLVGDIENMNLDLAAVMHAISDLPPDLVDARRAELQRDAERCSAAIEEARERKNALTADLHALTVTVSRLEDWWRGHGAVVKQAESP